MNKIKDVNADTMNEDDVDRYIMFLLYKLRIRLDTSAIIWAVVGVLQIVLGIYLQKRLIVAGVFNIIYALSNSAYSQDLLKCPSEIVLRFKSLLIPLFVLFYNIAFGAGMGVIGSVYYFVFIKRFVAKNKKYFQVFD